MSDDSTVPGPNQDPEPPPPEPVPPEPAPPKPAPPARVGVGAGRIALGAMVFVAAFLLFLGATRLVERGAIASGPAADLSSSRPPASGTTPVPSGSPGRSVAPTGSAVPDQTPAPSGDPVLVGAGDIGACDSTGDEATAALLDDLKGTVFTAGDNAYPDGTPSNFRDCFSPSWGRHLDRIRPAPGNHDWQSGDLTAYLDYFGSAAVGDTGDPWYAYELGTWRIVVLDSDCDRVDGCGPESRQGRWLAETLAASTARCTLAIWHHPRFSSGNHGDDTNVDPFWRALYAAGADVVVNGHDHDYERFAPQDPDGLEDRARGLREFVVGTGGTALRPFGGVAPNSELRVVAHGVLALTLRDGGYDWQFHPTSTDFSDRGTARCH